MFPLLYVRADVFLCIASNVAKTLLGQSSDFVSEPPPTVKLLELVELSVTELPSFKIKKPLFP